MSKLFLTIFLITVYSFNQLNGQTVLNKNFKAVKTSVPPKIDGNPNDKVWQTSKIITNFKMFEPGDGNPEQKEYQTQVKVLYDDAAIYILAIMNDPNPKKIAKEFGLRDQMVQADYFKVIINPFLSAGNNYVFGVFASGAQMDGIQQEDIDFSWNAVWKSAVGFSKNAWFVEMSIPYSALRFQNDKIQNWGIDFIRHNNDKQETYSWTYIDKKKSGDLVQFLGNMKNLKDLKPPVRLSLYPYTSLVHTRYNGTNSTNYGAGLDLKYGISDNYTLDATLIPDFSDTPFDNIELNLGPFEQYYTEKRQFFTEGMTLFNKLHLFYTRRVGGAPYYNAQRQLNANEIIVDNPENVRLINAIKISGQSKNGLGIAFFNAITNKTEAVIKNTITGQERNFETSPYTNYNVAVLNYNFKRTSSVGMINTNVIRKGIAPDADVIGGYYDLNFQKNTLNFYGNYVHSFIFNGNNNTQGNKAYVSIDKKIKAHKLSASVYMQDDKYNPNDLGYNRRNNFVTYNLGYKFQSLKPGSFYKRLIIYPYLTHKYLYKPYQHTFTYFTLSNILIDNNYFRYNLNIRIAGNEKDFYEPRTPGRFYTVGKHFGAFGYVATDYRKKLAVKFSYSWFKSIDDTQNLNMIEIEPRWRVNNRFKFNYEFNIRHRNNYKGYVGNDAGEIIFGNRQQKILTNSFGANYYFTTKSGLNLNFRYYWSPVHYNKYFKLNNDGSLTDYNYSHNRDINYNLWNLDIGYIWNFAPGSQLSLMYRNYIFDVNADALLTFDKNIDNLFAQPQKHSFIMKMTYYIDYNTVRNKWF